MDIVFLFMWWRLCLLSQLHPLLLDPIFYSADFGLNSQKQNIILPPVETRLMTGVCTAVFWKQY